MKKTTLSLAAAAVLALGACSTLEEPGGSPEQTQTKETKKKAKKADSTKTPEAPKAGDLADNLPNSVDEFTSQDREYLTTIETIASGDDLPNEEMADFGDRIDEQQVLAVQFGREVSDAAVSIPEGERTEESYTSAVDEVAESNGLPAMNDVDNSTAVKASAAATVYTPDYYDTVN